jgi:hypothetical protein
VSTVFQNGTYANVYLCQLDIHVYKPLQVIPLSIPGSLAPLLTSLAGILPSNYAGLTGGGVTIPNGPTGNPADHTPDCQS